MHSYALVVNAFHETGHKLTMTPSAVRASSETWAMLSKTQGSAASGKGMMFCAFSPTWQLCQKSLSPSFLAAAGGGCRGATVQLSFPLWYKLLKFMREQRFQIRDVVC